MVCHFLSFIGLKCSQFSFSFRLTFVSSSDHRLFRLLHSFVCFFLSFFFFRFLSSIFYLCRLKKILCNNTHSMWFESRFFFAFGLLLSLCTTFHVKHSTETESTERAFVASHDIMCVCVCVSMDTLDALFSFSFFPCHALQKAFASALRTVDDFMLLLLLLLSISLSSLLVCFWF